MPPRYPPSDKSATPALRLKCWVNGLFPLNMHLFFPRHFVRSPFVSSATLYVHLHRMPDPSPAPNGTTSSPSAYEYDLLVRSVCWANFFMRAPQIFFFLSSHGLLCSVFPLSPWKPFSFFALSPSLGLLHLQAIQTATSWSPRLFVVEGLYQLVFPPARSLPHVVLWAMRSSLFRQECYLKEGLNFFFEVIFLLFDRPSSPPSHFSPLPFPPICRSIPTFPYAGGDPVWRSLHRHVNWPLCPFPHRSPLPQRVGFLHLSFLQASIFPHPLSGTSSGL